MVGELFSIEQFYIGVLAFIRIGAILFALPIFGDRPTPVQMRVLMSIVLTLCLYPIISTAWKAPMPVGILSWLLVIAKEIFVGVIIGFTAKLIFDGMVMAAALVGYQMGFGMSNMMIPDADAQLNSFTAFHRVLIMLIFLSLGLHYVFLHAVVDSFELIPAGVIRNNGSVGTLLIEYSAAIFSTAMQLAAPVLISLLFTMAALGLVARAVPQMNIFTLSFPISFFIGIMVYAASLPFFPNWIQQRFMSSYENIYTVIRGLSPI